MLDKNIKIAGDLTVGDWGEIRSRLKKGHDWDKGVKFFQERINNRFLKPIKLILDNDTGYGEGFTAMSIACLLLETLQAFSTGACFDNSKVKYVLLNKEEKSSSSLIKNFLREQSPFKDQISNTKINNFISCVRNGLLHEAATKKNWVIRRSHKYDETLVYEFEQSEQINVIYRTAFFQGLESYFDKYIEELKDDNSKKLRENYIRKFDEICQINDET